MLVPLRLESAPTSPTPADAVGMLLECHERIHRHVAIARRLAAAGPEVPHAQLVEAAAQLGRYFGIALPLHAEDEDATLEPRLLVKRPPTHVVAALDTMVRQHAAIEACLVVQLDAWAQVANDPNRHAALRPELHAGAERLAELFEAHLDLEETVIFPAARALLTSEVLHDMAREMRERRAQRAAK